MGCFIVPASAGVLAQVLGKRAPANLHLDWFNAMVWGGSAAMAIEHILTGEIVPWFPFLSAMASPADTAAMLHEMAWVGIPMTLALVLVWGGMVLAYEKFKWGQETGPACLTPNTNII